MPPSSATTAGAGLTTSVVAAVFHAMFSLSATAGTGGTVSVSPTQTGYAPNSVVTVTATPAAGYAFTGWSGNASGTNNPLQLTMTANMSVIANFAVSVADIIVDDKSATFAGVWLGATASNQYGTDYKYALGTLILTTSTATFTPNIVTAGKYDIYVWDPSNAAASTAAPFLISSSGGSSTVAVNQKTGAGAWKLIASGKSFAKGTSGYVRISNNDGLLDDVIADAVKFVYSSTQ